MRFLAAFVSLALLVSGCTPKQEPEIVDPNLAPATIVNGKPLFRIRDLRVGKGKEAKNGRRLKVHYSAWFFDLEAENQRGKRFESTRESGKPFEFIWGAGGLIRGWEQGLFG